ncbi:NmrA family NAD(P)-binding protein [Spirosoma arcticum]
MKKVLVTGATGFQGGAVVTALLEEGFSVKALITPGESAQSLQQRGVEVVYGSLDDVDSLGKAFVDVAHISLVFPLIFDPERISNFARNVVQAYRTSAVESIVFNTSIPVPAEKTGYIAIDSKLEAERLFDAQELPYISIRPTIYLDNLAAPWSIPLLANEGILAYPIASGQPIAWLSHRDLVRYTVAAIKRPNLVGQKLDLGGLQLLTGDDLAQGLSTLLGKPIQYVAVTPDDFEQQLSGPFGPAREIANIYRFVAGNAKHLQALHLRESTLLKLPIAPLPFDEWARQIQWGVGSVEPTGRHPTARFFADLYTANDPQKAAALVDELVADTFVDHSPAFGGTPDKAGFRQTVAFINQVFEQRYTVEKLIQEGNLYTGIWTSSCQHVGEFMGVAPTQKQFEVRGITTYRIIDGKIHEHWEQFDVLTILQQLGIVSLP